MVRALLTVLRLAREKASLKTLCLATTHSTTEGRTGEVEVRGELLIVHVLAPLMCDL